MGVVTASASGGFEFGQNELQNLWSRGGEHVSAYQSFAWFYAVNTGQISIRHGMRGPGGVSSASRPAAWTRWARPGGRSATVRRWWSPAASTRSLCPWGWVAQLASGRLSRSTDPAAGLLPFDERACGHVPGEGGAILVAGGRRPRPDARGARQLYGEVAGYATYLRPAARIRRGSRGCGARSTLALADAGMTADAVDVVFADAAGVAELDLAEAGGDQRGLRPARRCR